MNQQKLDRTLNRIVRRLVNRFEPDQIILFDSHVRGTARPDSDIDLLVVLPVHGSKRDKRLEMRVALHDIRVPKDIIVATPEQVERQRNVVGTIIRPAIEEGQVLYERIRLNRGIRSGVERPAMNSPVYEAAPRGGADRADAVRPHQPDPEFPGPPGHAHPHSAAPRDRLQKA